MKITTKHYNHMLENINAIPNLEQVKQNYIDTGRSGKRFRWDAARAAKLMPFICDTLYTYLDDAHIDTALRRITNTK